MGHQIYKSKDVQVGATTIAVRQPIFKGQAGVDSLVRDVLTEARRLLDETLRLCNSSGFQRDIDRGVVTAAVPRGLFEKLFLTPPTNDLLSTVWARLALIRQGLNEPFGLKVYTQGDSSTNGYVNKYFPISRLIAHEGSTGKWKSRMGLGSIHFGSCARVDGEVLRDAQYKSALVGRGEIHVSFERLNSPMGPKTLIHEAAHKFTNMADFSYMYDFRYAKPMDTAKAMMNADSFAWLCFLAPGAAAATAQRRQNQVAANSDDGIGDLSALFG
jgi:hypothetical protein